MLSIFALSSTVAKELKAEVTTQSGCCSGGFYSNNSNSSDDETTTPYPPVGEGVVVVVNYNRGFCKSFLIQKSLLTKNRKGWY